MDLEKLKNPRGVTSTKESLRITILIVLATVVVAAYFFFDYRSKLQREAAEIDPDSYVEVPSTMRVPGAKIDPEQLKEVRDTELAERVVKEKDAYLHMIQQAARLVYGDMELLGVQVLDFEAVRNDPASFRGQPFEIKGELNWLEEITENDARIHRGYLTTPQGDICYFTTLSVDDTLALGDVVKLQGFFFKIFSFNPPGEEARVNDAVFLIGKHLIPSFYKMEPVHALDMNLLERLYDYDILDMCKPFEEKQLYHMLSYVSNLDEEKLKSIQYQEAIPPEILRKAGNYRGQPVQILGEIVLLPVERNLGPEGENPLDIKRCYHGILLNYRGGKFGFCYFMTLEKPDWMEKRDLVYLRGYFFRNYAYRTQNENLQPAPLIIATEFEKFEMPEDNTIKYISIAILAGTIFLSLFFLFQIFRDRKHNREFREKFIARKKKQVSELVKEGLPQERPEPENPPADPPKGESS